MLRDSGFVYRVLATGQSYYTACIALRQSLWHCLWAC